MVHTHADVELAIESLWNTEADREEVRAALAEYGALAYERDVPRVRLAIVRLSSGRIDRVRELVGLARRDYRDVLVWAECPEEGRSLWAASAHLSPSQEEELAEIRRRDREQHAQWLAELRRRQPHH
jgi:hypothetical protein